MREGIPEAGDIVRLYVGPSKGNEQDGFRAVLVISDDVMNEITSRFTGVPVTGTVRGWETEVPLASLARSGVALVDQIRSWSFTEREISYRGERVTPEELELAKFAIRGFLQL
ncbi:type II toxin-antitoxin system PemK/MazF family toxin [Paraburkholderia caballeronis]|uniref:type II toxin-antitoxin system PemK/MazF family toxin n=1 Tax=Paraburkholderia caballeronis TaxID=416943 RepID=UPI001065DDAE|nr:type II toxin-antitoxin system PemK/MazF family toxin [Paraburkholderia caballeronis]TDV11551.1 mRNA interferase MazF [Paraburkholderia caballeronis]TDV17442.1 mRNA interferase MazF [Paraburkholderia caballeronis]TDV27460.1 mRNA interferase MazF [Paraburkholderia caballeronis]